MGKNINLPRIKNNIWMTIYARYLVSKKGKSYLKDHFSEWFIEQYGVPDFIHSIKKSVLNDLPARSAYFEELIQEEINKARFQNYQVNCWAIGCGFDSRWERFNDEIGKTIKEYREFDFESILEQKKTIISNSPFKEAYSKITVSAGDLVKTLPQSILATNMKTLIFLEGIMMHLEKEEHIELLKAIRERVDKPVVFIEILSAFVLKIMNKKIEKYTGEPNLNFVWGPNNIESFLEQQGWKVEKSMSGLKNMFWKNKMLFRFLPLPKQFFSHYRLIKMIPST